MANTAWDQSRLAAAIDATAARLAEPLVKAGHRRDTLRIEIDGLIRYREQSDTVEVPLEAPYDPQRIAIAFKSIHQRLYGFATDEAWELDTLRVNVSGPSGELLAASPVKTAVSAGPLRAAQCWFENGAIATAFYDRETLVPEARIRGPAIIEDPWPGPIAARICRLMPRRSCREARNRSIHRRGYPQRADRDSRRDDAGHHALGALAAVA
jgi:N-methylhydantoinase A